MSTIGKNCLKKGLMGRSKSKRFTIPIENIMENIIASLLEIEIFLFKTKRKKESRKKG